MKQAVEYSHMAYVKTGRSILLEYCR